MVRPRRVRPGQVRGWRCRCGSRHASSTAGHSPRRWWPGGQRLTFLDGDRPLAKELLAITPVRPGHTVFQGWSLVRQSPGLTGSAPAFWAYRYQHWLGTRQDLAIYRDAVDTDGSVNEPHDEGILRYRRYYRKWVEHAHGSG